MRSRLQTLRKDWAESSLGSESSLHQLSPYIGKLKTSIARTLLKEFTSPNQVVFDPFSGSGVVPLESLLLGRSVIANDINPYAAVLTKAKMFPWPNPEVATDRAKYFVCKAKELAHSARYNVLAPTWVRSFFHRKTLAETKFLAGLLLKNKQWFLLANLLGILHHQRPGFLSYPSSHLVPYLRTRKFPPQKCRELYEYRDVEPRLRAKIERSYRRFPGIAKNLSRVFTCMDIRRLHLQSSVDVVLTSPPYMNALDYGRDNRLRLWFLGVTQYRTFDRLMARDPQDFSNLMACLARLLRKVVRTRGKAILIVGEVRRTKTTIKTNQIVREAFEQIVGGWKLCDQVQDLVPNLRRSRRNCECTKKEWILNFRKS